MANINMCWAITYALKEEMERDESIFIAGEDISPGGVWGATRNLVQQFGESRILDREDFGLFV